MYNFFYGAKHTQLPVAKMVMFDKIDIIRKRTVYRIMTTIMTISRIISVEAKIFGWRVCFHDLSFGDMK